MEMWCTIYKHAKNEEMYLYIKKDQSIEQLPDELKVQFAHSIYVMDLLLTPGRTLARENITTVMHNIESKGFHLQLPPVWGGHQLGYKDNNHE